MKVTGKRRRRRLLARLVAAVLVLSLLFFGYPNPLPMSLRLSLHDEPVRPGAEEGLGKLSARLAFYGDTSSGVPVRILADVAVDEEFVERAGDGWAARVYETVGSANDLLGQIGVSISVHSLQRWHSDATVPYISSHLESAEKQVERAPSNIFMAITGQDTVRYDGFAQEAENRVIVRFYWDQQERNPSLIAHEVGHLLGARHHEDEDDCDDHGCIMDRRGYAHATTWCHHHERVIQEYIASSLALLES